MRECNLLNHLETVVQQYGGKTAPYGLILPKIVRIEGFQAISDAILPLHRMPAFMWGDLWRSGEYRRGERTALVSTDAWLESGKPALKTLENYGWVWAAIPQTSRRREVLDVLGISFYAAVAGMHNAAEIDRILTQAAAERRPLHWVKAEVSRYHASLITTWPDPSGGPREVAMVVPITTVANRRETADPWSAPSPHRPSSPTLNAALDTSRIANNLLNALRGVELAAKKTAIAAAVDHARTMHPDDPTLMQVYELLIADIVVPTAVNQ
jgi:hypothetical protein